jgi:hypothetical protein
MGSADLPAVAYIVVVEFGVAEAEQIGTLG